MLERLTLRQPFRWQARLSAAFEMGAIPSSLDVPTGLGKTTVMAIWLAARATGADVPRRLVYVVDRRAVVDQATEVAEQLAERLGDGSNEDASVQKLRAGLGLVAGRRLAVSTLRGQHVDNRAWLEDPSMPAIIVGTVDMIGSRLLFQGYGISNRMRPVHAALLGTDALIVLDEAHLVPPFEALLRSVAALPRTAHVPALRVLTLSATGRTEGESRFSLNAEDEADERSGARLRAPKWVKVEDVSGDLGDALAQRAVDRAEGDARILVFTDSRKLAQKVSDRIASLAKAKWGKAVEPALLVGARRVYERSGLKDDPAFRRFCNQGEPSGPAFLVATSAGEVGVDLDADHLVMDLVPWERMVQRFGRVNRRAEPGESRIDVLVSSPDKEGESGQERGEEDALRWRAPFESASWVRDATGRLDASPRALLSLRRDLDFRELCEAATTSAPHHPALTRPTLEAWAMTSLESHPGRPLVSPWLRGWVAEEPETRILWRSLFPIRANRFEPKVIEAYLEAAPPHLSETLDVSTRQAAEWIKKRCATWVKKRAKDAELPEVWLLVVDRGGAVLVHRAAEVAEMDTKETERLLTAKTVVVGAALGGLARNGLLDDKSDELVVTADTDVDWNAIVGWRVRSTKDSPDASSKDWPVAFQYALSDEAGEDDSFLVVEVLRTAHAVEGDAAISRIAQRLDEHHLETGRVARGILRRLRLPEAIEEAIVAAAEIHDAGKDRALWQNAMRAPLNDGRPYAKTCGGGDPRALQIGGTTYRHEFGSVEDARRTAAFDRVDPEHRELAIHLVAAHHGFARPVIAAVDPNTPPSSTKARAREIAMRFHHLQEHWGPWGLAWLEAIVRAADWTASRTLNERGGQRKDGS